MSQEDVQTTPDLSAAGTMERIGDFVAVNFIACQDDYRERFETLFKSRAHAIDKAPGFRRMFVLRPDQTGGDYLVVSVWEHRQAFDAWRTSPQFIEGHRRGFDDVRRAKEAGATAPMTSRMQTYEILTD